MNAPDIERNTMKTDEWHFSLPYLGNLFTRMNARMKYESFPLLLITVALVRLLEMASNQRALYTCQVLLFVKQ